MVDVVDVGLGVDHLNEILYDLNDVFLCEDLDVHRNSEAEFLVESVTSDFTKIVAFLREEEVVDHLSRACIIGSFGASELTVDVLYGFFL